MKWDNEELVKQDRQCKYNVTLWRVRVTIVTVETQKFISCFFFNIISPRARFSGGAKILKLKCVAIFSTNLPKTSLILR